MLPHYFYLSKCYMYSSFFVVSKNLKTEKYTNKLCTYVYIIYCIHLFEIQEVKCTKIHMYTGCFK